MTPKKRIKDLKKLLRKDGTNPFLRMQLADLYAETGQTKEAVEVYLGVAFDYYKAQAFEEAGRVCQSIIDLAPGQKETMDLLKVVNLALRSKRASSEVDDMAVSGEWVPSLKTPAGERPVTATGGSDADNDKGPAKLVAPTPRAVTSESDRKRGRRKATADEADERVTEPDATPKGVKPSAETRGVPMANDLEENESLVVLTPTPLPAPMAPHDADDEDSVVEDEIERYKLRNIKRDISGPVPRISLPPDLEPVFDDLDALGELIPEGQHDPAAPDVSISLNSATKERSHTDDEVVSFLDEDPTQLTLLTATARTTIEREEASERLTTEDLSVEDIAEAEPEDAGDTMTMQRQRTTPRQPISQLDPHGTGEHGTWPGRPRSSNPFDEEEDLGPTGEHPIRASQLQVPGRIDHESTVRIAVPRTSPFLEEPMIGSNPFIDLPERPDGLPLVIHDDMELGAPLGEGLGEIFADGFAEASFAERSTTQRSLTSSLDPVEAFSSLPGEALKELASRMTMRHYATDQYIVRQEERARCCYVLVSGQVSLLRYDPMEPDGDYQELARLEPGQLFGESCLLPARSSRGSVLALSDCDLYEIPRRMLRELAAVHDGVDECLDPIYRERALDSLFVMHPCLRGLKPRHQATLRQYFETVHYSSGSLLLEEGQEPGGLFLVLVGAAEVTKRLSRSRSTLLATVEEGSYISDMSVLGGAMARATVRAAGPLELAVLPADRFREVIDAAPELWDNICAERGRGALERNYLLTGPGIMV